MSNDTTTSASDLADKVLEFPEAIPGFPHAHRFLLSDLDDEGTFQLLQNLEDPELSLVVTVPWLFFPDYTCELDDDAQRSLGLSRPEDAIVFCSVSVDPDDEGVYVNLLGPFVVNAATRRGQQVVQHDHSLPVRASLPRAS